MLNNFVRFNSEDGLELQGLFYPSNSNVAVINVHCLAGNFYESRFIDYLASELNKNNIAFFSFNTRGHDYISDFLKIENKIEKSVQIGAAHEAFEECVFDIKAAIDLIEKKGYDTVYLSGHSTGALKITFYKSSTNDQRVKGLILLSPSDDIGIQKRNLGKNYNRVLKLAEKLVKNGQGNEFMPFDLFKYPIIDARTYLARFGQDSKIGFFKYHVQGFDFPELRKVNCPVLAIFGTEKEAVVGDVRIVAEILKNLRVQGIQITVNLIEGASHNYSKHEEELAKNVVSWLMKPRSSSAQGNF